MTEYFEEYKSYQLRIWTEDKGLFGGEYTIGKVNRIWHEVGLATLLALFYEAVEKNTMNWQTKEVQDWLDEAGVLNSQREDIPKLEELVESHLLVRGNLGYTDRIKNLAITLFLKHVQWEQLVGTPNAWDDYEYKEDVS